VTWMKMCICKSFAENSLVSIIEKQFPSNTNIGGWGVGGNEE
jgi:hypothetical protein